MRRVLFLVLVLGVTSATLIRAEEEVAEEPGPSSGMVAYLERAGLRAQLEESRRVRAEQARDVLSAMIVQMTAQLPEMNDEFNQELSKLATEMNDSVNSAYSVDELLAVYAEPFDRTYPGDDLAAALGYLDTPEGRLMLATTNEAVGNMTQFQLERESKAMGAASQKFLAGIQELLQRLRSGQ